MSTKRSLTILFCLLIFGCSNGPTEPSEPQATLATPFGTVTVLSKGNAFDADRAVQAIEAGYSKARAQVGNSIDAVRLDGLTIQVEPGVFGAGAVGRYYPESDMVQIAQGVENVLTHELQHRFCRNLGNSGDCCTFQDHHPGYNLSCQPIQ